MIHFLAPLLLLHRCIWPPTSPGHTLPSTVCFPTSPPLCMSYPIVVDDYPPYSALTHYPHAIICILAEHFTIQIHAGSNLPISQNVFPLCPPWHSILLMVVHGPCLISELLRACREGVLGSPAKQDLCWGIPYP